ncbi:flagellar basal-body rod protein FlgF [Curvivirga aplysinae]|uniref:flagellar basal-body rod protein FlgF n=1 Tax=Curvivirga aplysinae TaxID=2529852 RepID=UPI0012BCC637|nr:flagellar basal-body rod protein FlgF [Curvivirga aplysinae]MTI10597.1 flagellar basal-body rod protein FlgF [Curvivirga aplysinae]
MENSAYIALSRQRSLRNEMNIVANNIANANTPAFKREGMVFKEYITKPQHDRQQFSFVQDVGLARDLTDGPMTTTNNPFDFALSGDGYFVIDTPMGERYTRNGRFQLDATGNLVNKDGYTIQGDGGPLNIPNDGGEILVASDGTISNDNGEVGKLRVVSFENQYEMKKSAGGLYATGQDPIASEGYNITQGMLEESNVQPILEITRMMRVHREYASMQKFTQAEDDRVKKAIERLGQFS